MTKERLTHTCEYFLRLVRAGAGLSEEPLPDKPDDVEWKDLFLLSDKHSLAAVTCRALPLLPSAPDEETAAAWKKANDVCIHADMQQLWAWEEIRETLAAKGLRLLPLKGLHTKYLYPETYLRLMGDLDILYEKERFPELKKEMEGLGYTFQTNTLGSHHQVFFRPPVTDVEMHADLLPSVSPFAGYYADPWAKAIPTEEEGVFRFSAEDEYIFMLLHAYKHFRGAGSGVRTILDFCLFRKKHPDIPDKNYVAEELQKLEKLGAAQGEAPDALRAFAQSVSDMETRWFQGEISLSDGDLPVFADGVYGKVENIWTQGVRKKGKTRYLFSRLFPPFKVMQSGWPVLRKLPFLLPFCWIARLFRGMFRRRKQIAREYRFVRHSGEEKR